MKKNIFVVLAITFAFTACNTKQNNETSDNSIEQSYQLYACQMHPEITGKKGDKCSKCGMELSVPVDMAATQTQAPEGAKPVVATNEIISNYLQLKNAFTNDNTDDAAKAGKALEAAFKSFDKSALTAEQKKTYEDIEDDPREHAEHIGANAGNIAHQREHFDLLSKDMYDLVKAFGAGQTLYKDFCPMYNDKKGAIWLSETKEIKNPYLGKAMPACGSVKEELK